MSQAEILQIVISFVGGLALFIYGMQAMADGLQKAASSKLKKLLEALTKNRIMGVLLGIVVTGVIQSSSATTVMVVGFVNAGIMTLTQATSVIMGANIGTTVTGWLVSSVEWAAYLNPMKFAPIILAVGIVMTLVSKKEFVKRVGDALAGFGLLFIGIEMMSGGVAPLKDSELFKQIFVVLGTNPLLGILAGALVTGIIQSSSASIGILQTVAIAGLVPWSAAVYIIMGQNIGTCVTALLSSIGASKTAKSAAYVHLLFNIIGSVVFSIFAVVYFIFINPSLAPEIISVTGISLVHTIFNVVTTVALFPFPKILIYLAKKITHSTDTMPMDESELVHLDDRILETPSFAVQNSVKEVIRMSHLVLENVRMSLDSVFEPSHDKKDKVLHREHIIDTLDVSITEFLVKICNSNIEEHENQLITSLFRITKDLERIGDHCENIIDLMEYYQEEGCTFSQEALSELKEITALTYKCVKTSIDLLESGDSGLITMIESTEEQVDEMDRKLRETHIQRLTAYQCDPKTGVVFLDILTNVERITDHALNISESVESNAAFWS